MIKDLRDIVARAPGHLARDALGVAAIGVMTVVMLYLPNLL